MFRTAYITSYRGDLVWFIGLPFVAIAIALGCQAWFSAVVMAAVATWITFPHHFATWLRTYALPDEWQRFRTRLIVGPVIIAVMTLAGLKWAPLALVLTIALWDHQHSIMQQHGFARIYDFKAGTGGSSAGRYDLALGWVLYINLLLTTPFLTSFWVRELYNFNLPVSVEAVRRIQLASWLVTAAYVAFYLAHVVGCMRRGVPLNPLKYAFIAASYFLWYFVGWQTDSLLVHSIAHRMMHGLQYIVIVHVYLQHKASHAQIGWSWMKGLLQPAAISGFLLLGLVYTVAYKLIVGEPLSDFTFGAISFTRVYDKSIPAFGMGGLSPAEGYTLFASLVTYVVQLAHFYVDSFIWKVRDKQLQEVL